MAQAAQRLIQCFCGCSSFTENEIKVILHASPTVFLREKRYTKLFENFLGELKGRINLDIAESIELIRLHHACDAILTSSPAGKELAVNENRPCLMKLLTPTQKEDFKKTFEKEKNVKKLHDFLEEINKNCARKFQENKDYHQFLDALRKKLK